MLFPTVTKIRKRKILQDDNMKYEKKNENISEVRMLMKNKNIVTLKLHFLVLMIKSNHSKFKEVVLSNNFCSEVQHFY